MKLHHIGIACHQISEIQTLLKELFDVQFESQGSVDAQAVNVAFTTPLDQCRIELIEATSDRHPIFPILNHPIKNFLDTKGQGIQHICFQVDDLHQTLERLKAKGIKSLFGIVEGY